MPLIAVSDHENVAHGLFMAVHWLKINPNEKWTEQVSFQVVLTYY